MNSALKCNQDRHLQKRPLITPYTLAYSMPLILLLVFIFLSAKSSFGGGPSFLYRGQAWCERPVVSGSAHGSYDIWGKSKPYKYEVANPSVTPNFARSRDRLLQFLKHELPGSQSSGKPIWATFNNAMERHAAADPRIYQDSPFVSTADKKVIAQGFAQGWANKYKMECGEVLTIQVPRHRMCSIEDWKRIIIDSGRPVYEESHPVFAECDAFQTMNIVEAEWVFLHEIPARYFVGSECYPQPIEPKSCTPGGSDDTRYTEGRTRLAGKQAGAPTTGKGAVTSTALKSNTVTIGGVTVDVTQLMNTAMAYLKEQIKTAIQAKAEQLVSEFESQAGQYSQEIYQDFLSWLNEQAHAAGISKAPISTREFEREFLAWIDSPQAQIGSYVEKYLRERYTTVAWLIDTYRDEASWQIINGLKGLWSDADGKLKRFTQAREEIAARPQTPYSEILEKYGFSGPWIDNFKSYEDRFTAFNDRYRVVEAGKIIVGAFQSEVPREKVEALFNLLQVMGNVASRSQIPIVSFFGDIVQIYGDVARSMLNQVNGLREVLRKRQHYCLGGGTTDLDDERQRAFSRINPSGDLICPTDLSAAIYERIAPNDGRIFFWVNGTFIEGKKDGGGIAGVRESMSLLKEVGTYRPGYAGKENDVASIARIYNVAYSHQSYGTGISGLKREAEETIQGIIKRLSEVAGWFGNLGILGCSPEAVDLLLKKEADASSIGEIRILLGKEVPPEGVSDVAAYLKASFAMDFVEGGGGAYVAYTRMWDRVKSLSLLFIEGEVREAGKQEPCTVCAGGRIEMTLLQGEPVKECQKIDLDATGRFFATVLSRSSDIVAQFTASVGELRSQTEKVDKEVLGLSQAPYIMTFGPLIMRLSGTVEGMRISGIRIEVSGNPKSINPGTTVTYTYEVENTGSCELSNIALNDSICAQVRNAGGDMDADGRLDINEKWIYECSMKHSTPGTITNTATATATDPAGAKVSATATEIITVTPEIVVVPNVIGHKREFAEQLINDAKLVVGIEKEEKSDLAVGMIFKQEPDYGTHVLLGTKVNIWVSQNEPRYIYIDPPRETKKVNEKVTFRATLMYKDGKEEEIAPLRLARWEPGPDNTFTCKEPGKFIISSEYKGASGSATVTCEEDWSAPVFEPPISKSGQRDLRAQPAPPEAYTWYVLCDTYTWDVVYGEHVNVARYQIVAGPFPGPRTAQDWIERNIPSRRCPPATGGGEWAVVCDRNNGSIGLTRSPNPQRHLALRGGFYGEPDARRWTEQNCPSWRCDSEGRCLAGAGGPSAGAGRGGNWAVVCNKNHGGVGLTQYPDPTRDWIWSHGFFSEPDARRWTEQNCPSWRCDAKGQCLTGIAPPRPGAPPLEVPPSRESGRFGTDQTIAPPKVEGTDSRPPLKESSPEKFLPPPPPKTSGPGKTPPSGGAPSVDNIPFKKAYGKRCTDMRDSYVNKVCTPVWSGCALVPVGCMGYVITGVLPDQSTPARSQCGKAVLENYLSCLQSCNNRLIAAELNMDSVGGCGAMCNETAVAETKACDAGAAPPSPTASSGSKPPIPKLEVAEESPLKILAGDWEFGRTQAPKPWPVGKISVLKLTLQRGKWGYIIAEPHHPNESFWELSGDTLLIKHADGSVTGRLTRKNPKDWHYWEGPYIPHKSVPTSGVRHYIKKAR